MSPLDNSLFVVHEVRIQKGQVSPAEMISELGTTDVAGDGIEQRKYKSLFLYLSVRSGLHICRAGLSRSSCYWIRNGIKL